MGKKSLSGKPMEKLIAVRVTQEEFEELRVGAGNKPLSTWLRNLGLSAVRKANKKKP